MALVLVLSALGLYLGSLAYQDQNETTLKPSDTSNWSMAYIMMEDFVKDRLQTPSTAEFPGILDGRKNHVKPLGGHLYQIDSWVDHENLMGAKIRTRFKGVIEQVNAKEWRLQHLKFENR